jgi:formylglycine-generating enzyme required for sulfatase activity/acetyl esterase/lipase
MSAPRLLACWWLLAAVTAVAAGEAPPPEAAVVHRLTYGEVDGAPVRMDLHLPAQGTAPYPWLIRYSSGIERPDAHVIALLRAGYAVALADHGTEAQTAPTPPWPQFPVMVRRGVRFLRAHAAEFALDPVRAGAFGWSRGGASVMLAGSCWWVDAFHDGSFPGHSDRLAAVIAIAGDFAVVPGDLRGNDLAILRTEGDDGPVPVELRRVAPWLTPANPPTLLIRGERDADPADALAVHRGLAALGVATDLWIAPGAGHGVTSAEAQRRVVAWADAHVRTAVAADLERPLDPIPAALALHRIGWHDAAEQVIAWRGPRPLPAAVAADVRSAEIAARLDAVGVRMSGHGGVTPQAADLARLRALAGADHPDLAPLLAEDARRRDRARAQADALRRRVAIGPQPWPMEMVVPSWATAHGADGFGPWAAVAVRTASGAAVQRFRWCPPGSAVLGRESGSWGFIAPEQGPATVTIARGFWLADTEVTQDFWRAVTGDDPAWFTGDGRRPVERVTHPMAEAFAAALRRLHPGMPVRLPLHAEWRWAARCGGTDTALFGACDDLDAVGWWRGTGGGTTRPVASLLPNGWGLYDLSGNVFEWCGDPQRERPDHYRTYAGGSYASSAERCRPESVGSNNRDNATPYHGLRLLIEGG